ncbi:hypothetical protein N8482_00555 [Chitinophagales bacterium]|nr:hypothetical protein [Chitinophagales bacterium]
MVLDKFISVLAVLSCFLLAGCWFWDGQDLPDLSDVELEIPVLRFDQDVFKMDTANMQQQADLLAEKYPEFGPFYMLDLLEIGPIELQADPVAKLKYFVSDPDVRALYDSCLLVHSSTAAFQEEMEMAFKYYNYYTDEDAAMKVIWHSSAFGPATFTLGEDIIGVNLELFLGADFSLYETAGFPNYVSARFVPEAMGVYASKAWLQDRYEQSKENIRFIDEAIYRGKQLYLLEKMHPHRAKELLIGYTAEQQQWMIDNEDMVWGFFVKNKLLYESERSKFFNYVSDGPSSTGMPPNSPGNVGAWIGWQIVKQFMKRNPDVAVSDMMEINDGQTILSRSKYKPGK